MRDRYKDIADRGAEVVAVGTGDAAYASSFVADTDVPFLVLVDDSGAAARAASVRRAGLLELIGPRTWSGSRQARREGHRVHRPGKRVTQLGATFVVGPGAHVRYEHVDGDPTDHAPLEDVLHVL